MDSSVTSLNYRLLNGQIGEVEAESRFMSLGFFVYRTNMTLPWDLLVERAGKYYKVQCKYRKADHRGTLIIKNRHWVGNKQRKYQGSDIDILTVYSPEADQVYMINGSEFVSKNQVTLRLYETRNSQKKDVCMAKDYINPGWLMALP